MTFDEILEQVLEMPRRRGRVPYRALRVQFQLDDTLLEVLNDEIVGVHQLARDQEGKMLVWTGDTAASSGPPFLPTPDQGRAPLIYTPAYLAEKILTSRNVLAGERKQVTVLFADTKDSIELIRDLDSEAAQQLLDPALHTMMEAVHRYEGTVNQVLGDGIMALFGAPLAHEDHALRACYAALTMQTAMREYTEAARRAHGIELRIRVGLNAGEVVVRTIGDDLHMDYSAVGQTTHLAARMEQLATPGTIRLMAATLRLVEGLVRVQALGPIPVKGLTEPVEVLELLGASALRRRLQARAGHGQVVVVVGEAGVGKSRLVYECVQAHHTQGWRVLGEAMSYLGEFVPARTHMEQALAISATPRNRSLISPWGGVAKVTALGTMAYVLWLLGYPDQALTQNHATLTYAQELQHAFSLARALFNIAILHKLRGEADATQEWAEAALAIVTEQGFVRLLGNTMFTRGWALAAQGQHEEGMAEMHQGLATRRAMGARQSIPEYLARLGEAYGRIGQADEGRCLLAEALALADTKVDCWYETKLHRIKGELLLRQAVLDAPQAEACFQQALAVARRQQARSYELRAAMSLSRLWQQQGKRAEARQVLAPIYSWFTEGFDTPDLQEAKALLEDLGT